MYKYNPLGLNFFLSYVGEIYNKFAYLILVVISWKLDLVFVYIKSDYFEWNGIISRKINCWQ